VSLFTEASQHVL